jgi:hypothetical protein
MSGAAAIAILAYNCGFLPGDPPRTAVPDQGQTPNPVDFGRFRRQSCPSGAKFMVIECLCPSS